jgi:hypothetical protein
MNASHTELNFLVGQDQAVGSNDSPTFAGVTLTGAFTSLGIDDNATAERLQLSDSAIYVGSAGLDYTIRQADDTGSLGIFGGGTNGAKLNLYGGSRATLAYDFSFVGSGGTVVYYDDSSSILTFTVDSFVTTSGAFTSRGINDDSTAQTLRLTDTSVFWGNAGGNLFHAVNGNTGILGLSGVVALRMAVTFISTAGHTAVRQMT